MVYGTLALKVFNVTDLPPVADDNKPSLTGYTFYVNATVAGTEKRTKTTSVVNADSINQILNFDVDAEDSSEVTFNLITESKSKPNYSFKTTFGDLVQGFPEKKFTLESTKKNKGPVTLSVESTFTIKNETQKAAGQETARAVHTAKAAALAVTAANSKPKAKAEQPEQEEEQQQAAVPQPQTALSVAPTHRPWFTRVSYYYDTTKHVYAYTTSFRLVASVARFGENSANVVLQKVSGKSLNELDEGVLVPVLSNLDDKVDATISTLLTKLFEGQQYVLKKKDEVVETASSAAHKSTTYVLQTKDAVVETASNVAHKSGTYVLQTKDAVVETASNVAQKSSTTVTAAVGSTLATVVAAKDYTTTQVTNVSSSAYGTVRGAAVYVLSHVPVVGAKIRA